MADLFRLQEFEDRRCPAVRVDPCPGQPFRTEVTDIILEPVQILPGELFVVFDLDGLDDAARCSDLLEKLEIRVLEDVRQVSDLERKPDRTGDKGLEQKLH